MIRTLLTTTALAALLSTVAVTAQETPAPADPAAPAVEAPMSPADPMAPVTPSPMDVPDPAPMDSMGAADSAWDMSAGYTFTDTDIRASEVLGATLYSSAGDEGEAIGDVNELILTADGEISAVIVGVGGFLGLGEKNVAVDFNELEWTTATDGSERWVLATTREALEAAPDFVWADDMNDAAMAPADPAMAPADPAMAPADGAMTPVDTTDTAMTPIDPTTMQDFDETTLTAEELIGTPIYGTDNTQIATVGDFLLGEDGASIDALIVDVGGFLGIGVKEVAIGFENLSFLADENGNRYLSLPFTREQFDAAPAFNRDTYGAERDTQRLVVAGM